MAEVRTEATISAWEGGGGSPYAIGSKKLGMWLFILSDSLTFSALVVAYSYVRVASPDWPRPFEWSSIVLASVMTFCLLSSSLTMVMAVLASKKGGARTNGVLAGGNHPGRSVVHHSSRQRVVNATS